MIEELQVNQPSLPQAGLMDELKPVEEGLLPCEMDNIACEMCQSEHYYELDEDNWYLIGLAHKFKY